MLKSFPSNMDLWGGPQPDTTNNGLVNHMELSLVFIVPTYRVMAGLSEPGWLVTYQDGLPLFLPKVPSQY